MYDLAFLLCGLDDHRVAVLIPLYVVGRDDDGVDGSANAIEIHINLAHQFKRVHAFLDDKQIYVAVAVHVAPGGGPEEDDLLRLGHLHNSLDDVVQRTLVDSYFFIACSCVRRPAQFNYAV